MHAKIVPHTMPCTMSKILPALQSGALANASISLPQVPVGNFSFDMAIKPFNTLVKAILTSSLCLPIAIVLVISVVHQDIGHYLLTIYYFVLLHYY